MDRTHLQHELDALQKGATLELHVHQYPRELEGPLTLRRPITLDGKNLTIWARRGPVLMLESDGIVLRNLTIEMTGDDGNAGAESCALMVGEGKKIRTEAVEVRGAVVGVPGEEGQWQYPRSLHLGQLAHRQGREFIVRVIVPVQCRLHSEISGIDVEPEHLIAGRNEIVLRIDPSIPKDTLLHGPLYLLTAAVKRRITVTGHVVVFDGSSAPASSQSPQILWEPQDWLAPPLPVQPAPLPAAPPATTPDDPSATPATLTVSPTVPTEMASSPAPPPRYPAPDATVPPSPRIESPLPPPTPPSVAASSQAPGPPPLSSTRIKVVTGPQLGDAFGTSKSTVTPVHGTESIDATKLGSGFLAFGNEPRNSVTPAALSNVQSNSPVRIEATRVFARRHSFGGVDTIDWLLINDISGKMIEASSHHGQLETDYDPGDSTRDLPSDAKELVEKLKKFAEQTDRQQWPRFVVPLTVPAEVPRAARSKPKALSSIFSVPADANASRPQSNSEQTTDSNTQKTEPAKPASPRKVTRPSGLPPIFGENGSGNG